MVGKKLQIREKDWIPLNPLEHFICLWNMDIMAAPKQGGFQKATH